MRIGVRIVGTLFLVGGWIGVLTVERIFDGGLERLVMRR